MRQEKPWGWIETLQRTQTVQVDKIGFRKGAQSSGGGFHMHPAHSNQFIVLSGRLYVEQKNARGEINRGTSLGPGESLTVTPGVPHRFTAEADGEGIEVYALETPPMTVERNV